MNEDEHAIRGVVAKWMEATRAGDLAAVLSLMADDVIFIVPGQKPFGKEAFAAALQGMKNMRIDGRSDVEELEVAGNWAFLRNHIEIAITPEGGPARRRAGYTLTILRKEADGRWLVARDANLVTSV